MSDPTAAPSWRIQVAVPDGADWIREARGLVTDPDAAWARGARAAAHRARLPHMDGPVAVTAHVHPVDGRRRAFDPEAYVWTAAAALVGLVDAGVLDDLTAQSVTDIEMRAGARVLYREHPRGLLTLDLALADIEAFAEEVVP